MTQENTTIKPKCKFVGENGNTLNLLGITTRTLKSNNMSDKCKEVTDRVFAAGSYTEALNIMLEYVDAT